MFLSLFFQSLQTPSSKIKNCMFATNCIPLVFCIFPEHQRTAYVQWTPFFHWISASLSLTVFPSSFCLWVFTHSQAFIISVPSLLHHPFLFSEPKALSLSQAVSLHLSPPSSHQYPSISPSPHKQSDPSVCCRLSASRLFAISLTLPLLWVNMTHTSIILLSFCHYLPPEPFSISLHVPSPRCLSLSLSSLGSSSSPLLISLVMTNTSISFLPSLKNPASSSHSLNLSCHNYVSFKMFLSKHPSLLGSKVLKT